MRLKALGMWGAAALVALSSALVAAQPSKSARGLGQAYRAYLAGDYEKAARLAGQIEAPALRNPDYLLFVRAQSASVAGDHAAALADFEKLAAMSGSRFAERARWRIADCLWELQRYPEAADAYRARLREDASRVVDPGLARFRLAANAAREGRKDAAIGAYRSFRDKHPTHPLDPVAADRLRQLSGDRATALSHDQRIDRAIEMLSQKQWRPALAELRQIPDDAGKQVVLRRDFWTGMTYFKMRRRYKDAGEILLRIYPQMGKRADEAMFHGARALSRADLDERAIEWYQKFVDAYPRSRWADEAQYLSGWLWFNMGEYARGLPYLEKMRSMFRRSRWTRKADWYIGFSHFLLGDRKKALPYFEKIARRRGALRGGKGRYWAARTRWLLGRKKQANAEYRELIERYPFTWYALLARARLARQGIEISPFGDNPRSGRVPAIASEVPASIASDPALADARELIAAGLDAEAGLELRRDERAFLKRHRRNRPEALRALMDVYRDAGNYNRPWMLAVVRGRRALDMPPKGKARIWWEHAYPRAYRDLVEEHAEVGDTPPLYMYSIMRKESGFDPHVRSYANAIGLMQMIPRTTRRVARAMGIDYTADLLFDPSLNIKVGSWYVGRLLAKFKGQIPQAAGSYNGGPAAIMKWLRKFKGHPADIWGELASYSQTRGYMKKVTAIYARYVYLYKNEVYDQPLEIEFDYVKNDLNY